MNIVTYATNVLKYSFRSYHDAEHYADREGTIGVSGDFGDVDIINFAKGVLELMPTEAVTLSMYSRQGTLLFKRTFRTSEFTQKTR